MRWKLVDRETGAENAGIDWRFRVGDRVRIRLVNEMDADHQCPTHPFHVHGAGRFRRRRPPASSDLNRLASHPARHPAAGCQLEHLEGTECLGGRMTYPSAAREFLLATI